MGICLRIFIINENNSLKRLMNTHYYRLLQNDKGSLQSRLAGQVVRCAFVYILMQARKPVSLMRIDYSLLYFDEEGYLDNQKVDNELRLIAEFTFDAMAVNAGKEGMSKTIIDAVPQFARQRYHNEYRWHPPLEVEKAILKEVFAPPKKRRFRIIRGKRPAAPVNS